MCASEYLQFLTAVGSDTRLHNALHNASRHVRSPADLVRFAAGCGYRFAEEDIPMAAAQCVDSALVPTAHSVRVVALLSSPRRE